MHIFQGTASGIQSKRNHYPGEVNSSESMGIGTPDPHSAGATAPCKAGGASAAGRMVV